MDDYLTAWMRFSFVHAFTIKRRRKKSMVEMMPSTTIIILLLFCSMAMEIQGECFGGVETYEKTAGVGFATSTNLQGLVSQPGTAVTRDCAALCRQTTTCAAFAVDYAISRCQSIDADSIKNREHLKDTPGVNYFEKICLRRVSQFSSLCGDRQWAFERVIGATLQGFDELEQANVQSRADCQRLCLEQTAFICRSAEYDEKAQICRLSREDRRTQPQSFRKDGGSWDYLENQCVRTLPDCRYAARTDGSLAVSMDQVEFAQSQGECESLCDQARVFTCRAYSFTAEENRCYLSGDDSISHHSASGSAVQFDSSLPIASGKKPTIFAEKICSVSQCENGIFTFEKVTGHFLRTARQEMLSRGRLPPTTKVPAVNDSMSGGITVDCGRTCLEMGADCPAYSVDYLQGRCFKLDRNTQGRAQELTIREGMSYFEKICLRGNVGPCRDRAWAFERHPGKELRGMDERTIPLVATRRDCQEACLKETRFVCRSARYDTKTLDCKLSSNDKRLRPDVFMNADSQTVEYLENQCAGLGSTSCTYQTVPDMYARYMDSLVSNIADDDQCQQLCSSNRPFSCRSYSFYASGSQCFISSDDRVSGGLSALQSRPGTNYTERNCSMRRDQPSFVRNDTFSSSAGGGGSVFNSFGVIDSGTILEIKPESGSSSGRFPSISGGGSSSFDRTPVMKNADPIGGSGGNKCRSGRTTHYQKVAGYEAVTSRFMSLRPASSTVTSRTGILVDCLSKCTTEPLCEGINYNPAKESCVGVESGGSNGGTDELVSSGSRTLSGNESETPLLRPTASIGYFESLCLQVAGCLDSAWSSERTPGYFMRGVEREIVRGVSRLQCTERCLDERRFVCRSASYDTTRRECHLSTEDRYSQQRAFQSNPIFDYIENQCSSSMSSGLPELRQCRYGPVRPDRFLLYADRMVSGVSQAAGCQAACDAERNFRCRSYSLHEQQSASSSPVCSLSSSTSTAFEFQRGSLSAEKTDCLPVSTNEIPAPGFLETAPLGPSSNSGGFINNVNRDQPRILSSGSIGGSVAGSDPGGWVSLAALSRTQVNSGKSPANYYPNLNNFNPLLPRPDVNIRRPLDVTIYDSGFQYNTVGVSSRPFNPTADSYVPVFVDNSIARCRGVLSYDKVANADFVGARRQEIRLSSEGNPTLECLRECDRLRERCLSVVMSTDRFIPETKFVQNVTGTPRLRCYILDRSAAVDSAPLPYTLNSMYYEKTCLPESGCGKLWTFVLVHGYELEGLDTQVTRSVASKEECQSACLRSPTCRSAEFVPRDRLCRMSPDNRRTNLRSFRASTPDTIYMENQCAPDPPQCEYSDQVGRVSPWYDRIVTLSPDIGAIQALADCRQLCDSERDFLCKSVSVQLRRNPVCLLSADDSVSLNGANGVNSLMPDREFTYSERSNCGNVRVECTKTDMVITLAFGYPFNGRVYVNGNYQSCFEMGNGQNQMVMRIPLVGNCGTVQQNRGRYINNIIVQHNPLIMQDTDSNVRVECAFEASEQTISYSPGGRRDGSDMGFGSIDVTSPVRQVGHQSVVTNTAPTPALRMRILSQNGQESRIVGLGEQLTLRIEIDPTSAFGITARNVEARTDSGEVMTLIDATGCPRDANIFPPMDMDRNSKSLTADFKAFRFPTTATVNFVATVGFCQERCEPSRCVDGWESYGRRRREVNDSEVVSTTTTQRTEGIIHLTSISSTLSPSSVEVSAETREETGSSESHTILTTTAVSRQESEESSHPPVAVSFNVPVPDNEEELTAVQESEESNLLPYEVPLHLQLIVREEVDRKIPPAALPSPLPSTAKTSDMYEPLPTREQPYWRSPYLIQAHKPSVETDVCSSKSTVVAVSVVAVLMNVALLIGFFFFYRAKRASWNKLSTGDQRTGLTEHVYGLRPSGSVSEVTFRSVYGQKSGPGTLTRAFNLDNPLNSNPRGPHVASVFSPNP